MRAALEGCESKQYDEGFADAENSIEPVINEARKLTFKEGWLTALQAVGVPEDSPLKDPNQIPLPSLPTAAQKTPVVADEEETTSLKELVQQINAHAEPIDLEATGNPNVEDQHSEIVQPPPDAQHAPVDAAQIQFVDPSFNSWIQFLLSIFISRLFDTFSFKSLPMSLGCGD